MRNWFYIISLVLIGVVTSCKKDVQPSDSGSFMKFYSKGVLDQSTDLAQTSDGGYIIVGYTQNALSVRKALAIKLNQYGGLEWQKNIW